MIAAVPRCSAAAARAAALHTWQGPFRTRVPHAAVAAPPSPAPTAPPRSRSPQPFVIPKHLEGQKDDGDDTLMLIAGGGGMFLCMAFAAVLPRLGVPAEHVMTGGMLALLSFILYIMFCPTCGRKGKRGGSGMEDVTPVAVFVVTGCIGTMLGGMFGGVLKNMPLW
jgi:hypothetical protein